MTTFSTYSRSSSKVAPAAWLVAFIALLLAVQPALHTTPNLAGTETAPSAQASAPGPATASEADRTSALREYGRLPMRFEPNRGQTDPRVRFLSRGGGYTLFLTPDEAVLTLRTPPSPNSRSKARDGGTTESRASVLRMQLVGANPNAHAVGTEPLAGKVNYLRGGSSAAPTGVPTYGGVRFQQVYPGVDVVYYGVGGRLEYDFVLAPGADPASISLRFQGADPAKTEITPQGELVLHTPAGRVVQHSPVAYAQDEQGGARRLTTARWTLGPDGRAGFSLGKYDSSKRLVIDPILSYSTYLAEGVGYADAVYIDHLGYSYIAGDTASTTFPTTSGVLDRTLSGPSDAFVMKLNPAGTGMVFATYLGGTKEDVGSDIVADLAGNVYLLGETNSSNFPTTAGAWDRTCGTDGLCNNVDDPNDPGAAYLNADAFMAKFNPTGSQLLYSTYLGGGMDEMAGGLHVDGAGTAYVSGTTWSTELPYTKIPMPNRPRHAGDGPGVLSRIYVAKLNSTGTSLLYYTQIGGFGDDFGTDIAVDSAGAMYVTGVTNSTRFPVTSGAFDRSCGTDGDCNPDADTGERSSDGFVTKISPNGASIVYSTYLGGRRNDYPNALVVDSAGQVFVTGTTYSSDDQTTPANESFPNTPGAFDRSCGTDGRCNADPVFGEWSDAFVAKLNAAGSALVYSTLLGGSRADRSSSIQVNAAGTAYVAGTTNSSNFPIVAGAFDTTCGTNGTCNALSDGSSPKNDVFVVKFNAAGSAPTYSSFVGGSSNDIAVNLALDPTGDPYVLGRTFSSDYPVTSGAFRRTYTGSDTSWGDAFATKLDTEPPVVTVAPVGRNTPNASLGTSLVPVSASWSATDTGTGVARYELWQRRWNGTAWEVWAPVGQYTTTSAIRSLPPNNLYQFGVRAQDQNGRWSGIGAGAAFRVTALQENSSSILYSSGWLTGAHSAFYGGQVRYSTTAGAKATLTFTGRSVGWVATRDFNRGRAKVYVDGVLLANIDLGAASLQARQVVFAKTWSAVGQHKIEVRVEGTAGRPRVEVDAFIVVS